MAKFSCKAAGNMRPHPVIMLERKYAPIKFPANELSLISGYIYIGNAFLS